jgi:outer membrane protein assembly factor BamA
VQSSIWTPGNTFNLQGDWQYLKYPQDTYGFGGYTTLEDKYTVSYQHIRLYEILLRNIKKNLYIGGGYQLDQHWEIMELEVQPGRITDFEEYGFNSTSTSSGIVLDVQYDTRENSINPKAGSYYANVKFVQNLTFIGANSNWNSVTFDLRKYIKMPHHSLLALWLYSVCTLSGNPPYLDLPATGSDTYNNTGRGYEQGRFTGKNMVDLEAEFRFNISKNHLIGGVVFGNAESLSELNSNTLKVFSPAIGCGLRINFNKFSRTNVCIDYGIGTKGSRGFAGNLGEVF